MRASMAQDLRSQQQDDYNSGLLQVTSGQTSVSFFLSPIKTYILLTQDHSDELKSLGSTYFSSVVVELPCRLCDTFPVREGIQATGFVMLDACVIS
jgi:hypothetical protein